MIDVSRIVDWLQSRPDLAEPGVHMDVCQTWGVSHVLVASLYEDDGAGAEELLGFVAVEGNCHVHVSDTRHWSERADYRTWADGLEFEEVSADRWRGELEAAQREVEWEGEPDQRFSMAWLHGIEPLGVWEVREGEHRRYSSHGLTRLLMVRTAAEWILLETRWES